MDYAGRRSQQMVRNMLRIGDRPLHRKMKPKTVSFVCPFSGCCSEFGRLSRYRTNLIVGQQFIHQSFQFGWSDLHVNPPQKSEQLPQHRFPRNSLLQREKKENNETPSGVCSCHLGNCGVSNPFDECIQTNSLSQGTFCVHINAHHQE